MALIKTPFDPVTEKIIKAGFRVHDELGGGYLERVYESALCIELLTMGLMFERQKRLEVYYRGQVVGEYVADLVIESAVLIELKAVSAVTTEHHAQCLHYLKSLNLPVGLIMNFGQKYKVRRFLSRSLLPKDGK